MVLVLEKREYGPDKFDENPLFRSRDQTSATSEHATGQSSHKSFFAGIDGLSCYRNDAIQVEPSRVMPMTARSSIV